MSYELEMARCYSNFWYTAVFFVAITFVIEINH